MLHCSLLFGAGIWLGKTLCLPPYIWWSACLLSQFAFIARRPWRELAMAGLLMGSGGILFASIHCPFTQAICVILSFEMLNRLLYEGKSRLPQNATSDLIRRDPRFGLKPIWRQAPFSALKVGSRHLVKFGSELWVFPLQKSPKELLPPSKECSNALYHHGAHGPSSARFSPT